MPHPAPHTCPTPRGLPHRRSLSSLQRHLPFLCLSIYRSAAVTLTFQTSFCLERRPGEWPPAERTRWSARESRVRVLQPFESSCKRATLESVTSQVWPRPFSQPGRSVPAAALSFGPRQWPCDGGCLEFPSLKRDPERDTMAEAPQRTKWQILLAALRSISVEPVMLLDGVAYSNMVVLVENLQMDKVCRVNLNHSAEVCGNLSEHKAVRDDMTREVSVFAMYNGIITSIIPLFFILFMGAWSDKYGRKTPLLVATLGHLLYALGYLVNSAVEAWPVEYLLFVALLDSLGGGTVSFLTAANSYMSDVTTEEARTSRLGLANSIWFLGGPIGTFIGTYIYQAGGYQVLFGTSLSMYLVSCAYIIFLLPESHGPFANVKKLEKILAPKQSLRLRESIVWVYGIDKEKKRDLMHTESVRERAKKISLVQMVKDFFNPRRFLDSFRCTLKKREGHVRIYILLLIFSNLLRKLGRGAYMYLFTRHVLHWQASDYGIWVTYKNLLATLGSLVAVPVLSAGLKVSDNALAMVGALSSVFDYILYGLVSEETYFFMWLAPLAALLVNSCAIAIRAMLSKYVTSDEVGEYDMSIRKT
ncbi:putative adenylate cyclase [Penaeus vannamei]|uniref:Putative adenylate cyclase n=1 Tax=Penaeus vannamei TaxID=6689 RepID=A0A3R7QR93_PENVA|nr:putative adenylate cyclase [Penaeus vannamei]